MKLTQISLAVAAAFVAGQALALTPATVPDVTLHVSGASAPTKNFYKAMIAACQPGSMHLYENPSSVIIPGDSGAKNFFAYFCTYKNTGSYPAVDGKKVLVYHSVDGGSFNSIGPVLDTAGATQFPIAFLKDILVPASSGCSANPTGNNADGIPTYTGCASAVRPRPALGTGASDGGLADVEPAIFTDQLGNLDAGDLKVGALNIVNANIGQVFGVAVSDALYQAMQTAQKTSGYLPSTCVAGDFTPGKCQPSIDKQQYASVAANSGNYHTDWSFLVGAAGTGKNVNLCRRVSTSGTQASSNVYFLENPCARTTGIGGQLAPSGALNSSLTYIVTEGSGTGDVKTCLNNANAATNFAAGIISAENTVAASDHWHFVKLDWISPNAYQVVLGSAADIADGVADGWAVDGKQRQTAIDGKYNFAFETTINWISDAGVKDDFFNNLAASLTNPLDAATDLTGLFISPLSGFSNTTYPARVAKGTRFANSCSPFLQ